ncbi:MAG TPA: MFS transporter [Rhizomicrobium sp.]|nr:MFS transporter [Rhizomicrobium sp.]
MAIISGVLWRHSDFMRLWAAQTVSSIGARIAREGLALASVLTIDAKPFQLGILAALIMGPSVVVGFFAGGFVDRSRKRAIMVGTDVIRALVLLSVPVAAWFHILRMEQLYVVGALIGGANILFDISDHAYLPHLIGRDALMEGNTKLSTTESLAEVGGPALAGILVQALTAPFAIAVNAATYVVSALFLGAIATKEPVPENAKIRPTLLSDLAQGYSAMAATPVLRPLLFMSIVSPLFGGVFSALYVIFAIKTLGLSPALMGLTVAVGGIGSLAGTAISRRFAAWLGIGRAIVLGFVVSAVSAIFVPLASGPIVLKLASLMVAQFVGDSMAVAAMIPAASLRQSLIPRDRLGRAAAFLSVGAGASAVVGALTGGALGSAFGPRVALFASVAGLVVMPVWASTTPLWRLAEIPAAAPKTPLPAS